MATTQDQITELERSATATRISILRAERDEKLLTINDEAIKAKRAKNISAAEITDIEAAAATKRLTALRQFSRDVVKEQTALQERLEVKPLEFKVASVDFDKLRRDIEMRVRNYAQSYASIKNAEEAASSDLIGQLARREITASQFDTHQRENRKKANDAALELDKKFHNETLEDQKKANQDALDNEEATTYRRLQLIDRIGSFTSQAESSLYQIKANAIDGQIQNTQAAYDQEIKAAGENAALKLQIQTKYDKQLKCLNYEKAKAERDQAIASVAINTAVAIAKDLAQYGFVAATPFVLGDAVLGGLQLAAIYSKPLPAYSKGRKSGPAEMAHLAERGAELAGQPKTGYRLYNKPTIGRLAAGDQVLMANETQRILAQNDLVEGRIMQKAHSSDLETQTTKLRVLSTGNPYATEAAQARAAQARDTDRIVRAIQQQEYYRLNEQDDMVRRVEADGKRRDKLEKRYKRRD